MKALAIGVVLAFVSPSYCLDLQEDSWVEDNKAEIEAVELLHERKPEPRKLFDWIEFGKANEGMTAQLDAVNPIVDLEHDDSQFLMTFTVFNPTKTAKNILKWATPMFTNRDHHIGGNVFEVRSAAGHKLEYSGRDMRMGVGEDGKPPADAFVRIEAGKSVTNRVNPATSYQWIGDGYYYIRVRQPKAVPTYMDVMRTFTKVYLKNVAHQMQRMKEAAATREDRAGLVQEELAMHTLQGVGAISYEGCTADNKKELAKWHADAKDKIAAAQKCTVSNSCKDQVDLWFGQSVTKNTFAAKVTDQYSTMLEVMDKSIYACSNNDIKKDCSGTTFAFVYPTDKTQKIYMCPYTFNYPDYGEKVQTVIHELSHFKHVGNTNDNTYGEAACHRLAKKKPANAMKTADNIAYFGKYQPGVFCNAPAGYDPNCKDEYSNCNQAWMCQDYKSDCCKSCGGGKSEDRSTCGSSGATCKLKSGKASNFAVYCSNAKTQEACTGATSAARPYCEWSTGASPTAKPTNPSTNTGCMLKPGKSSNFAVYCSNAKTQEACTGSTSAARSYCNWVGSPTKSPTKRPTKAPTKRPTKAPTKRPTKAPTRKPTKSSHDICLQALEGWGKDETCNNSKEYCSDEDWGPDLKKCCPCSTCKTCECPGREHKLTGEGASHWPASIKDQATCENSYFVRGDGRFALCIWSDGKCRGGGDCV